MDIHRVSLHPGWAAFLIIRDLPFMPEREADVVQTLQQAIALEIVDRKSGTRARVLVSLGFNCFSWRPVLTPRT